MRRWNAGPKILVGSVVSLLLSIGLCSTAGGFLNDWGVFLFFVAIVAFFVGLFMTIFNGAREGDE